MRLIENEYRGYKYNEEEVAGKTFECHLSRVQWNRNDFPEFRGNKYLPTKEFIRIANSYGVDVNDLGTTRRSYGYDDDLILTGKFEDLIDLYASGACANWRHSKEMDPYWEVLYHGKMI